MIWGRLRVPSRVMLLFLLSNSIILPFFSKSSLSLILAIPPPLAVSLFPPLRSLCITISILLSSAPATGRRFCRPPAPARRRSLASLAHWWCNCESSPLNSDLSLTNSLETSSLVLWDNIRRMVSPVSSMWMRRPSASQHAHEPCKGRERSDDNPQRTTRRRDNCAALAPNRGGPKQP